MPNSERTLHQPDLPVRALLLLAGAMLAVCGANPARAQAFPDGPISIVVPFAPGGPTDLIPRTIAPHISEALGVPVTIDNRPGAAGNVGAGFVAKSRPDGRRLLLFQGGLFTVNPWLFKEIPFDPLRDFIPITDLASTPNVMVVNSSLNANTIDDLIGLIRAKQGGFNYGTPGRGTSPHLCVELFRQMGGGLEVVHVPFKSGPAAVTALLSNDVQFSCMNITAVLPSVKANRLRVLGISSAARSPVLPDVPTLDEAGLKGFEASAWFGLAAPAATPAPVVARLNAVVRAALADPKVVERFATFGMSVLGDTSENVARNVAAESAKWRKLVETAGIGKED